RFPKMIDQTIADNCFTPAQETRLEQLQADIPDGSLRLLTDGREDAWPRYLQPYLGQNWLEVPWLFVEIYYFRRILEATGYFENGVDPFASQKEGGLQDAAARIAALGRQLAEQPRETAAQKEHIFQQLLSLSLWGNQADMSLFPAGSEHPNHADEQQQADHTLVDDRTAVIAYLASQPYPRRIDFIMDNAAFELVSDLFLADFLLHSEIAQTVNLHVKEHPYYVSDTMEKDVLSTLAWLAGQDEPALQRVSARLSAALGADRLHIHTHPFWTLPTTYWQMPEPLRQELSASTLLISKGDLNYRRWMGDRHWDYTTPINQIICYAPAPLLLLRTLKSDVAAGLAAADVQRLNAAEPGWDTSGRYGVIQFVEPPAQGNE
ncbi:MAG: protein-glutamate O-methyltransferase family protein, partial [Anaerolineales bacterium]|nr:protein-glutamate O-methyltransferase family protein [Anaerolineales bacterium]